MEPITKEWIYNHILVKPRDTSLEDYVREKLKPNYTRIVDALQSYLLKQKYLVENEEFYVEINYDLNVIEHALGKRLSTTELGKIYWNVYKEWFATYFPCVEYVDFAVYYMMINFRV